MSTYILTSMFPNGFGEKISGMLREKITKRERFAFVASEFYRIHEKTDKYFHVFLDMLKSAGIEFCESYVVDGRMDRETAQKAIKDADVIWLAGGDTPTQFGYFVDYGLVDILKKHNGVIIGMSAGTINMAKTAICTLTCGHSEQKIYNAIGCVDMSVEPHFDAENVTRELYELSKKYTILGLPDDAVIVVSDGAAEFYGDVYKISDGMVTKI